MKSREPIATVVLHEGIYLKPEAEKTNPLMTLLSQNGLIPTQINGNTPVPEAVTSVLGTKGILYIDSTMLHAAYKNHGLGFHAFLHKIAPYNGRQISEGNLTQALVSSRYSGVNRPCASALSR